MKSCEYLEDKIENKKITPHNSDAEAGIPSYRMFFKE